MRMSFSSHLFPPMTPHELLDRHFLEVRARLLEIAATLDRLDRAESVHSEDRKIANDPRLEQLLNGLTILQSDAPNRAEQIQQLFSLPYSPDWRTTFGM